MITMIKYQVVTRADDEKFNNSDDELIISVFMRIDHFNQILVNNHQNDVIVYRTNLKVNSTILMKTNRMIEWNKI